MAGRLQDKVCIITGSGGSMGRAASLAFAREGARIVGCDISDSAAETLAQVKAAGGDMVSTHPCDLTKEAECQRLVDLALDTYGCIDVLYNNGAHAQFAWLDDAPDTGFWYETIDQELTIVFLMIRAAWPALCKNGGSIISTASLAGLLGHEVLGCVAHSAAKGGVAAMTRQVAVEGRKHNIRANSISPGLTSNAAIEEKLKDPAWHDPMINKIMLGRPGRAEEIANLAVFLASDESSFITGSDVVADGGANAW